MKKICFTACVCYLFFSRLIWCWQICFSVRSLVGFGVELYIFRLPWPVPAADLSVLDLFCAPPSSSVPCAWFWVSRAGARQVPDFFVDSSAVVPGFTPFPSRVLHPSFLPRQIWCLLPVRFCLMFLFPTAGARFRFSFCLPVSVFRLPDFPTGVRSVLPLFKLRFPCARSGRPSATGERPVGFPHQEQERTPGIFRSSWQRCAGQTSPPMFGFAPRPLLRSPALSVSRVWKLVRSKKKNRPICWFLENLKKFSKIC
jgi:hypothetical protein